MKELHIFATSDRPDQYLNSIVHCINKGAKNVTFVQIQNSNIRQIELKRLIRNVTQLFEELIIGNYKYFTGDLKGEVVNLNDKYKYSVEEISRIKQIYDSCFTDDIIFIPRKLEYYDLRNYISEISKSKDIILDVTPVSKVYTGDIFACCLLENFNNLYAFEIPIKPDYDHPWKNLIHEFDNFDDNKHNENKNRKKLYRYVNLVETQIFKESRKSLLIKGTPLLVSILGTALLVIIIVGIIIIFGFDNFFLQIILSVGTVLSFSGFYFLFFPPRAK